MTRSALVLLAAAAIAGLSACADEPAAPPPDATAAEPSGGGPVELEPVVADTSPDPWAVTSLAPDGQPVRERPLPARTPDVVFVPTPRDVVSAMLRVADVGPDDVLYDLGSGDGRIPITAARAWGTRGVGVEIDPALVEHATMLAGEAGVADRVRFIEGDMFELDLSEATVVTLYLLPELNLRLRPKLLALKPGTRIVAHNYHMGDWLPEEAIDVGESVVYLWTVPEEAPAHL